MTDSRTLARRAAKMAFQTRIDAALGRTDPVSIFDLVDRLGLELKFRPETSLDGMYCKEPRPTILISAFRPPGRQAFTCAHELGHHLFGHGTRVDEYLCGSEAPPEVSEEEVLANAFANFFLMPPSAITHAFEKRGWQPRLATPLQVYMICCQLGVGYETLINQLEYQMKATPPSQARILRKTSPKDIRLQFVQNEQDRNLVLVDLAWEKRAIDLELGDILVLPSQTTLEGGSIAAIQESSVSLIVAGVTPGIGRIEHRLSGWSSYVRVCRKRYVGRYLFRFNEDPDDTADHSLN